MYAWIVGLALKKVIARVNAGRPGLMVKMFAPDAEFVFPGESSWAGTYRGRDEIRGFLDRFVAAGLQIDLVDVVVSGAPWSMRIVVRYTDRARRDDGLIVYENEGLIYDRLRRGRIAYHEVLHHHPERLADFDTYLTDEGIIERKG